MHSPGPKLPGLSEPKPYPSAASADSAVNIPARRTESSGPKLTPSQDRYLQNSADRLLARAAHYSRIETGEPRPRGSGAFRRFSGVLQVSQEPKPYASAATAVSAVNIPARRAESSGPKLTRSQEPKPYPSASSAPSALSGFDFGVCFPPRLRVSAVNILLLAAAQQNTEAPKRLTMVIHPLNSLTGTEV